MDYEMILDEIIKFENLTSQEIQDELVPIIKSYNIDFLSKLVNVSKDNIHRICKSLFVNKNQRVSFKLYIKLLALGKAKEEVCREVNES